jgi:hypothetical protein
MSISLKHSFGSGKLDGTDATLVQPSNWNSEHVLAIGSPKLFGRTTAIGGSAATITNITAASPGVFTATNTFSAGQLVTISGVGGMTQLNGNTYVVSATDLSGSSFKLLFQGSLLSTASFTAYTSGGTATPTGTGVAEELSVAGTLTLTTPGGVPTLTGTGATTGKAIAVAIVFS